MEKWIAAFIPKYVSNTVLLTLYRFLAVFGVPRFVRRRHFRENCARLGNTNWSFLNEQNALIENQSEWENIRFGVGRRQSMAYAGCEIIATYNAGKALGGRMSRRGMAELIEAYEARGAALWGAFGVAPTMITKYFKKNGFMVKTADGADEAAVAEIACGHNVMIATAYNDKNDITAQIHTVCITKKRDGGFVLHNAYQKDEKGRYSESRPYLTFQEAVAHISGREPKLIYLIGLREGTADGVFIMSQPLLPHFPETARHAPQRGASVHIPKAVSRSASVRTHRYS